MGPNPSSIRQLGQWANGASWGTGVPHARQLHDSDWRDIERFLGLYPVLTEILVNVTGISIRRAHLMPRHSAFQNEPLRR
jgi:hypothetical protein